MAITLGDYYTALAAELGDQFTSTATSGSNQAQLEDTAWPIKSSLDVDDEYNGQILWRPNALTPSDTVRYVKTAQRSNGLLFPDNNWTLSPAGETYHLLTGLAPVDGTTADMRTCLNEGLKRCYWPVEVLGTPTINDTRHSMATIAPWLTSELMVLRVGVLHATEDRNKVNPYSRVVRGRIVRDGNVLFMDTYPMTFQATDVLYMDILKRGYDQCCPTGGIPGAQSGLSLPLDECVIPTEWATAAALIVAWRRNEKRLAQNPNVQKSRFEAALWYSQLTEMYLHPLPRTFMPVPTLFGPARIGMGSSQPAFKAIGIG